MDRELISSESIHGDKWVARLRREHERHAGLPAWGHGYDKNRERDLAVEARRGRVEDPDAIAFREGQAAYEAYDEAKRNERR